MGNGINNWNPNNLVNNWRSICMNFDRIMPFMGQTLWQVGPLPWMMNNNGWFANSVWGQVGDFTHFSGVTPSQSTDPAKTPEQTHAEKREAHVKKVELERKFDKLLKVLNDYVETLDYSTTKTALVFDINTFKSAKTQDNYKNLLELYNANKDKIKQSLIDSEKLTAKEKADLVSNIEEMNTSILDDSDKSYASVLEGDPLKLKEDIDVLDLISTYHTKKAEGAQDFIMAIVNKYKDADAEKKSSLVTLADKIEEALEEKYEAIKDNNYLTDETKKNLKKAYDNFVSYNNKLQEELYAQVFNDFYKQLRLAEAEKADATIADKLGFLDESENEFKAEKLKKEVVEDLKQEGFANPTDPPANVLKPANSSLAGASNEEGGAVSIGTQQGQEVETSDPVTKLNALLEKETLSKEEHIDLVRNYIQNQEFMNKNTVVDILDKCPDLIISLNTKGLEQNTINRVVKAVMRKAIELNLRSTAEYKELEKYFGAYGTPVYKSNGYTADNDTKKGSDTFGFSQHYGKHLTYMSEMAEQIQDMVNALVAKIKEKTTT